MLLVVKICCQGKIIEITATDTDSKTTEIPKKLNEKKTEAKAGQEGNTKEEMEDLAENEELIRDWLEESV